jgi:hypothetical protein
MLAANLRSLSLSSGFPRSSFAARIPPTTRSAASKPRAGGICHSDLSAKGLRTPIAQAHWRLYGTPWFSGVEGNPSAYSPRTLLRVLAKRTSKVFEQGHGRPMQSKTGPRLAVVAGTSTLTVFSLSLMACK